MSVVRNVERAPRTKEARTEHQFGHHEVASLDMTRSENFLCRYTAHASHAILCQSLPKVAYPTAAVFRVGTGYVAFHFVQGVAVGHGGCFDETRRLALLIPHA